MRRTCRDRRLCAVLGDCVPIIISPSIMRPANHPSIQRPLDIGKTINLYWQVVQRVMIILFYMWTRTWRIVLCTLGGGSGQIMGNGASQVNASVRPANCSLAHHSAAATLLDGLHNFWTNYWQVYQSLWWFTILLDWFANRRSRGATLWPSDDKWRLMYWLACWMADGLTGFVNRFH